MRQSDWVRLGKRGGVGGNGGGGVLLFLDWAVLGLISEEVTLELRI